MVDGELTGWARTPAAAGAAVTFVKEAALLQRNLGKIGLAAVLLRGWESTAHAPSKVASPLCAPLLSSPLISQFHRGGRLPECGRIHS